MHRCCHAAGLALLLEFYKSQYFIPGEEDVPRSIGIADPSEYYVAQAVATAGGQPHHPGLRPVASILRRRVAGDCCEVLQERASRVCSPG